MSVDENDAGAGTPKIRPDRWAKRAPAPPAHDGPDQRSATPLDGPTALYLAMQRRRRAREAIGERPAASAGGRPLAGFVSDDDIDDEVM